MPKEALFTDKLLSICINLLLMVAGSCIIFPVDGDCRTKTADPKFTFEMGLTGQFDCLSPKETELFRLINKYRKKNGLPSLVNSRALNKVASIHAMDLYQNDPAEKTNLLGEQCNMHSWSNQGYWTPICYTQTRTRRTAEKMWNKPREITEQRYGGIGYENVYWTSAKEVIAKRVLEAWKNSPSHNALILETGIWKGIRFSALGVGIHRNYAVMWVSTLPDPRVAPAKCP